jgi:hypothetical protein
MGVKNDVEKFRHSLDKQPMDKVQSYGLQKFRDIKGETGKV